MPSSAQLWSTRVLMLFGPLEAAAGFAASAGLAASVGFAAGAAVGWAAAAGAAGAVVAAGAARFVSRARAAGRPGRGAAGPERCGPQDACRSTEERPSAGLRRHGIPHHRGPPGP